MECDEGHISKKLSTTSPETLLEVTTNANTCGNGNKVYAAKSFENQDRLHKKHAVVEAIDSNTRRSIGNNVAAVAPYMDIIDPYNLQTCDILEKIDMTEYNTMDKPVVIAVSSAWATKKYGGLQLSSTSATHYYLNLNVPETNHILSIFADLINPVPALEIQRQPYSNPQLEQTRNRYTIETLLTVNPQHYEAEGHIYIFRVRFGQKARPGYPNFTLDAVLKPVTTPVLTLPPPEPVKSPAAEIVEGPSITSDLTTTDEGISQSTQTDVQAKSRIPEEKTKKTRLKRKLVPNSYPLSEDGNLVSSDVGHHVYDANSNVSPKKRCLDGHNFILSPAIGVTSSGVRNMTNINSGVVLNTYIECERLSQSVVPTNINSKSKDMTEPNADITNGGKPDSYCNRSSCVATTTTPPQPSQPRHHSHYDHTTIFTSSPPSSAATTVVKQLLKGALGFDRPTKGGVRLVNKIALRGAFGFKNKLYKSVFGLVETTRVRLVGWVHHHRLRLAATAHKDVFVYRVSVDLGAFGCHQIRGMRNRARQNPPLTDGSSSQQPSSSGSLLEYKYLGGCTRTCEHCGALYWFEERLKRTSTTSHPRYNRCCKVDRVALLRMEDVTAPAELANHVFLVIICRTDETHPFDKSMSVDLQIILEEEYEEDPELEEEGEDNEYESFDYDDFHLAFSGEKSPKKINEDLHFAAGLSHLWEVLYSRVNEHKMLIVKLNVFAGPLALQCAEFFKKLSQTEVLKKLEIRKSIAEIWMIPIRLYLLLYYFCGDDEVGTWVAIFVGLFRHG
uniref:Nucleic acid-binding, OB-fold protein n=1 Tax=Tanacetum cinerariifolium TaxID=118510 RepID=A0A6L2LZ28_TANCI|nr:nucleic acid-binding, OB-fold protein [Tanacetum cinerariifolium]